MSLNIKRPIRRLLVMSCTSITTADELLHIVTYFILSVSGGIRPRCFDTLTDVINSYWNYVIAMLSAKVEVEHRSFVIIQMRTY